MSSKLKAVIFDLDGVITNTASYHYKAWKMLADELGIYFDEERNELLKGVDRMGSLEIILGESSSKYSDEEKRALADRKNENYKELINGMTPEDILPGAVKVLKALRTANIKTGMASVSKNAFTVVDKLKIREYFDFIADANKIKKGKPDPEIFLHVAENLGVKPTECIGVEDAVAGIKSIKSAGMFAVGIGEPDILTEADVVIPGLTQFDTEKYINRL